MPYPTMEPTARAFDPGDWPIKSFKAQSGVEIRILYGSARTGLTLELTYENISDENAEYFLIHYDETIGTLRTFDLPEVAFVGWDGNQSNIDTPPNAAWRYSKPPSVTAVRPGRSSVKVDLVGVI